MNSRALITAVTAVAVASSAFAYRAPLGPSYRAQPRVIDNRRVVGNNAGYGTSDRELKQAIKAKRKQAKEFRKAGDPRAAQAEQELRVLQDQQRQWHASNQNDRSNRHDQNNDDRNVNQRNERDDDREGDRVHGKQKKNDKDHGKHDDEHDNDDDQDR